MIYVLGKRFEADIEGHWLLNLCARCEWAILKHGTKLFQKPWFNGIAAETSIPVNGGLDFLESSRSRIE